LQAEVTIDNQDIGFIREGQPVRIKLAAYPFQKYGMMDGIVKTVSADAQQQQRDPRTQSNANSADEVNAAGLAFKATVLLNTQNLEAASGKLPLAAGMSVSAEIIEDKRTVFEYLQSPVQRVVSEAGRMTSVLQPVQRANRPSRFENQRRDMRRIWKQINLVTKFECGQR
jgi:hemolysin D